MFCYDCEPKKSVGRPRKAYQLKCAADKKCATCGVFFAAKVSHQKHCSAACRNKASNSSDARVHALREKYKTNPAYNLKIRLRSRLHKVLSGSKSSSTEKIIGCSYAELVIHIQRQFLSSMSWDNMGSWHIDHIVPLASAKNEEELYRLSHFSNLRPLWSHENMSKGAKIEFLL